MDVHLFVTLFWCNRDMDMAMHSHPDDWIETFFAAKAVQRGGVIRRSVQWVEHEIGRARFIDAVRARGFALLETGGQFVVICSRDPIRRLL